MRRLATTWCCLLVAASLAALVLVTPAAAIANRAPSPATSDEADYVERINRVRAEHGAGPLEVDPDMTEAARDWAIWMAERGVLQHAHDIVVGAPVDWLKVGENVGRGPSVASVWEAFLASDGHRENLLDAQYTRVGVGVVWAPDGRLYTTHRFASTLSSLGAEAIPIDPDPSPGAAILPFEVWTPTPPPADPERLSATMDALVRAGR